MKNPRRKLIHIVIEYRNARWAVIQSTALRPPSAPAPSRWMAAAPVGRIGLDEFFDTQGEAFAYADKMARREKAS